MGRGPAEEVSITRSENPAQPIHQSSQRGRHYFAIKFSHVLKANAEKHAEEIARTGQRNSWSHRVSTLLSKRSLDVTHIEKKEKKKGIIRKLRPDMIRRMDDAPKLVNPSGYAVPLEKAPTLQNVKSGHLSFVPATVGHDHDHTQRNTIDFEEDDKRSASVTVLALYCLLDSYI